MYQLRITVHPNSEGKRVIAEEQSVRPATIEIRSNVSNSELMAIIEFLTGLQPFERGQLLLESHGTQWRNSAEGSYGGDLD